jgi:hypothetical protein
MAGLDSSGLRGTRQWCMLNWRRGEPALAEDGRSLCGPRRSWGAVGPENQWRVHSVLLDTMCPRCDILTRFRESLGLWGPSSSPCAVAPTMSSPEGASAFRAWVASVPAITQAASDSILGLHVATPIQHSLSSPSGCSPGRTAHGKTPEAV